MASEGMSARLSRMGRPAWLAALAASLLFPPSAAVAQIDVLADFRGNQALRFDSRGHAKAQGLNFTIRYPRSWTIKEGERPHVVQNFVSTDGSGANCNIIVRDSGGMTPAQARASVRLEAMRAELPEGMIYITGQSTTLDAHPASELQGRKAVNRAGIAFETRIVLYATADGTNLFLLNCVVPGRTAAEADRRFAIFLPLFRSMANSIVFPNQYR